MRNAAWPALLAVGIQGRPRCSCQDGLQVVCQLLYYDGVMSHCLGNINQLALLSKQVAIEYSTPCQPALYTYVLAGVCLVSWRQGVKAKAKAEAKAQAACCLARALSRVQQLSVYHRP